MVQCRLVFWCDLGAGTGRHDHQWVCPLRGMGRRCQVGILITSEPESFAVTSLASLNHPTAKSTPLAKRPARPVHAAPDRPASAGFRWTLHASAPMMAAAAGVFGRALATLLALALLCGVRAQQPKGVNTDAGEGRPEGFEAGPASRCRRRCRRPRPHVVGQLAVSAPSAQPASQKRF